LAIVLGEGAAFDRIDSDTYADASISAFKAILGALSSSTERFLEAEVIRVLEKPKIRAHIREIMPCLYAAAFLSLSGREISEDSITKTLSIIKVEPNPEIVRLLFKANVRSHLVYLYAYYLLLAFGKLGSKKEIMALVKGIGIQADPSRLNDVLAFLEAPEKKAGQNADA
jgi:ribosomal protein L12E/L44/L45/RPP1/RPP2